MKTIDGVGITFVNAVINRGSLNGVINLTLGVCPFTPDENGVISAEMVVAARLRMDRMCAVQLRDELNSLIENLDKADAEATFASHESAVAAQDKPN